MKILVYLSVVTIATSLNYLRANEIANLNNVDQIQRKVEKASKLNHLKMSNGKYPNKVRLLEDNTLSKRLKSLLKDRFLFLKKTWAVETPIEVNNNIFKASGCKQHFCDSTNFIIVIDFKRDVVYVGIRDNEIVKLYSEDGSSNKELTNWSKRISN
jgi:hypothetical protein